MPRHAFPILVNLTILNPAGLVAPDGTLCPAGCYRHTLIDNELSRRRFMSDTLERLNEVFQQVFDDDELAVGPTTTAEDVEGWDSLMHVTLMIRVEKAFGVKFTSSQVAGLKNVGQLVELLDHKLGN